MGDEQRINVFHNKCLRRILKINWQDHVTTRELLEKAETELLSEEVKMRRWKMIGHILRRNRNSHTNIALSWIPEGKRRRGKPKTTWRRTVERERNSAGWRTWGEAELLQPTEKLGGILWRPYVPRGTEKLDFYE
ncbi:hypothetical protein ACROYT_G000981 [Oculina patagonica]